MFYQNHSLALSCHILQFNFKKSLELDLKNLRLPYWSRFNFMIYWTWTWEILEPSYWTCIDFMIYWTWA